MKVAIAILMLLAGLLAVGLLMRHNKAIELKKADDNRIAGLSNLVVETRTKLDEKEAVSRELEKNLDSTKQELTGVSNVLVKTSADLAKTQKEMQAAAEAAKAEMAKRDARIADLENQKDDLTKKMDDLNVSIGNLGKLISDTEKKLAASEGDREFLLKELKRLQTEKAELERQFNDLSVLRTQVAKLKEELSVTRRLEWIRMGIYGAQSQKGAERLLSSAPTTPRTNFNLNVELKQDGSANVVSPATTNRASTTPDK